MIAVGRSLLRHPRLVPSSGLRRKDGWMDCCGAKLAPPFLGPISLDWASIGGASFAPQQPGSASPLFSPITLLLAELCDHQSLAAISTSRFLITRSTL